MPLHLAHGLAERAARSEGIGDLGLVVGQQTSAFTLGVFGQMLQRALTVYDYLRTGIRLIGSATSGERFWLSTEGARIRVNQFMPGKPGGGHCQADLYTLAITINMLRRFAARSWAPDEISLLAGDERLLGDRSSFGDARIITGQPYSSFTIPRALLKQPISRQPIPRMHPHRTLRRLQPTMPEDFLGSVERLVIALLADGYPDVHLTAEAASMSPRTLQRRLAAAGLTYSQLVTETRTRLAAEWLKSTAMPISAMAASLGYTDVSNFTRAFRRRAGISPRTFRQNCRRSVACCQGSPGN